MSLVRLAFVAAAAAAVVTVPLGAQRGAQAGAQAGTPPDAPLRVVRATPDGDASPSARLSVTFDRPVAGSLDRAAVDPASLLRVEPSVPGRIEWRDPATIRLTPSAPLVAGARYTVTVAPGVRAMDGSTLAEPYRFTFRVHGPTLLTGSPVGPRETGRERQITPTQRFDVVYSAPVDLAALSNAAQLEFAASCAGGGRIVRLRAASQRALRDGDPARLREAGGWQRDRTLDGQRRVVQLVPERSLPRDCAGELVVQNELGADAATARARWAFDTYGDLRIAGTQCREAGAEFCPTGPVTIRFTTPVRGHDVLRRVRLLPAARFTVDDTASEATTWTLDAPLAPRRTYAVVVDTALRDVYGQPLRGNPAAAFTTTGYAPEIDAPYGRLLVERLGFRTLAVQHVNVDTLVAEIAPVPERMEARALTRFGWADDTMWTALARGATTQRLAVRAPVDRGMITGVRLPVADATRAGSSGLFAVRVSGRARGTSDGSETPTSLVQITDLGVHVRLGAAEGYVWVTGVSDGSAKRGAVVQLFDPNGQLLATSRTDARGLARLAGWAPNATTSDDDGRSTVEGYVRVTLGTDRAYAAVNRWDPDLAPWRFDVASAWDDERLTLAGAVFTERGIYRPGERVYAKAIVRDGALGALRVPSAGDSVRWRFHDRDDGMLREVTSPLSAFGTADRFVDLPRSAAVGDYAVEVQARRRGAWRTVGTTRYRVAEYRPPEFLVDLTAVRAARLPGDTLAATVQARYLFGARMGRAALSWSARQTTLSPWELEIPGLDGGWHVGRSGGWSEEYAEPSTDEFASGADTLDARGERTVKVALPVPPNGRAARVTLEAIVTDVNRQVVGQRTTTVVHPADLYVAARPSGTSYFWRAGAPVSVSVLAVKPTGDPVVGTRIAGTIVRREWHRVRRVRNGVAETVGDWVQDTVARCTVLSAATPRPCSFTPNGGGEYTVRFTATDAAGRSAETSFERWASGAGWVPWNDESQFKMDVVPDRSRYAVGDTATVLFAAPFTNAEAWITVEREGLIEQRRMRLTSGATTLKFPITEAYAPNAFVSIVVARGRSAKPGPLDDPGRPTMRVGYAELRVTPEVKRLTLSVAPERAEYRPGDSARVRVQVRDAHGSGQAQGGGVRSEVTLWAVDDGVLALTGYTTPDPIDLIYRARGLGMRLASNMTGVAPQVPDGEKGRREAGGGGGAAGSDVLRSRFQTTAFFLGSVVTDATGAGLATVKLPDNLTTFRVMAVAVTAGDRYGRGEASLLVTRPLLARQALPRFVRPGDTFTAGAVINRRDGAAVSVTVRADATGVALRGGREQRVTLAQSRGAEVRFPFQVPSAGVDSAEFRFDVTDGTNADAVRVALPWHPDFTPRTHTVAGVVRDTASVVLALPSDIDQTRSRLSLQIGPSPLATIRGMAGTLRVYPYSCSEQVVSAAIPLIALYRAQQRLPSVGPFLRGTPLVDVRRAVELLTQRQRADGGIGYWSATDWTTPWLSAYAGAVLLDARDAGVAVNAATLARLASYLTTDLKGTGDADATPVASYYATRAMRLRDQVAAVDFLSRFGRPDVASENELLRMAAQLTLEDRARLATVFARRRAAADARRLMAAIWPTVRVDGRRAVLPDDDGPAFYFTSHTRPLAQVLAATLAVEPEHALIGPLVEALADEGRVRRTDWQWNTQDYASAVAALADFERRTRSEEVRTVQVRSGDRVILARGDSAVPLRGLLSGVAGGQALRLAIAAGPGSGAVYFYVTVSEVPSRPPTTPVVAGITVERWYEPYDGTAAGAGPAGAGPAGAGPAGAGPAGAGRSITSVVEGELVRVRLRLTVPTTRHFVVLDDALPAGLEAVDLSLRTAATAVGPGASRHDDRERAEPNDELPRWVYGTWDGGWWSPFDHRELRDDRVVYSATVLWPGTYSATYLARATTAGTFVRPPAHAEEMYNPAVHGRSDGGTFTVTARR